MYQPHNAKKCYLYWKIQIISFLDVALHPWRHSMATKGVEGSKSVLKAANDAGGDSLLFCVRKCDQKSLPQVKNYYPQSFSITNCQSFGWKCGQRWYKPFIIKIIMSTQGDFESILKIQTRPLICFPLMGLVYLCHLLWSNLTCVCVAKEGIFCDRCANPWPISLHVIFLFLFLCCVHPPQPLPNLNVLCFQIPLSQFDLNDSSYDGLFFPLQLHG